MSMFKMQRLADSRALITGDMGHKTVVSTYEFDALKAREAHAIAEDKFDAAVTAFYAPITDAIDSMQSATVEDRDPAFFVVEDEGTEAVAGSPEKVTRLLTDTVILRMIESGDTSRLIWIDDTIEVLAYEAPMPEPEQPALQFDEAGPRFTE